MQEASPRVENFRFPPHFVTFPQYSEIWVNNWNNIILPNLQMFWSSYLLYHCIHLELSIEDTPLTSINMKAKRNPNFQTNRFPFFKTLNHELHIWRFFHSSSGVQVFIICSSIWYLDGWELKTRGMKVVALVMSIEKWWRIESPTFLWHKNLTLIFRKHLFPPWKSCFIL